VVLSVQYVNILRGYCSLRASCFRIQFWRNSADLNWREEMRSFRGFYRAIAVGGFAVSAALLSGTRGAYGSTTLGLSTTTVQNAASQQILVTISGTDTNIQSSDLYVQIGDGGSANGGISTVP